MAYIVILEFVQYRQLLQQQKLHTYVLCYFDVLWFMLRALRLTVEKGAINLSIHA